MREFQKIEKFVIPEKSMITKKECIAIFSKVGFKSKLVEKALIELETGSAPYIYWKLPYQHVCY